MADTQIKTIDTVPWDALREEGVKYLQEITGHLWTDFKVHDPGITLLEVVCYAITDLEARLNNNIEDILARLPGEGNKKDFFTPREILTINPVTINDYRKLLIDIKGVKNAWLVPARDTEPSLYFDKDNNALLYDYATGSQRITLNGLYRVFIEKDDEVTDEEELRKTAEERLLAHRNLGEEFVEIRVMEQQTISIYADIQISEDADACELMARIYCDLEDFISPRIKQYSLKRMLVNGKRIEEIFNGPQLENGFIDDDELGTGQKRKELYASDLIRLIMAYKDVIDVKSLFISSASAIDSVDKKEWALPLDDTKALLLESFNTAKIRLFRDDMMTSVSSPEVMARVNDIRAKQNRDIYDNDALDIDVPKGRNLDLTAYEPLTDKLPSFYGVGSEGLPSSASMARRAQAKQLRAYLLFFEQVLINYFKQLDSFKDIFSFKQESNTLLKTYFAEKLPESIWKDDLVNVNQEDDTTDMDAIYPFIEDDPGESILDVDNAFNRKNRILNHLLAQFNEKFSDYALFGYKNNSTLGIDAEVKKPSFLKAKSVFLAQYPHLSRNRNRAYNFVNWDETQRYADGLKELIASKLGLDVHTNNPENYGERDNFYIVEHILLRPDGVQPLDFICSEKITDREQPDPYSYKLTFIIAKRAGRFGDSKFKELVYKTIETETPAHISYKVLEFDPAEMTAFRDTYKKFLTGIKNIKIAGGDQYNPYRNELIEILDIGRVKLPVLHLDAKNIAGDGSTLENNDDIRSWKDLSRNNNDAERKGNSKVYYIAEAQGEGPYIKFGKKARLEIKHAPEKQPLLRGDFTIVTVFKGVAKDGHETDNFKLISGNNTRGLSFTGGGYVCGDSEFGGIAVESTLGTSHMAIYTRDMDSGRMTMHIDGILTTSQKIEGDEPVDPYDMISIGPAADDRATAYISEIIILDSVLTGMRRMKLEEHLAHKWRIALSAVSSIHKPVMHLDANTAVSVVPDEKTSRVQKWTDLSLNSSMVTELIGELQPMYVLEALNRRSVLRFTGSRLQLAVADDDTGEILSGNFTIAIVFKADIQEGRILSGLLSTSSPEVTKDFTITVGKKGGIVVGIDDQELYHAASEEAHFAVITGVLDGATGSLIVSIHMDGKASSSDSFSGITDFTLTKKNFIIGGANPVGDSFTGNIAEIVIYNESLSVWDRQRLEYYFSEKWAIDRTGVNHIALPVLHLDASQLDSVLDEDGPILDSGTRVYRWDDLSYFDTHVGQNVTDRRPWYVTDGIAQRGAVLFTQKKLTPQDYFEDSLNCDRVVKDDFTIMVVFKADDEFYAKEAGNINTDEYDAGDLAIDINENSQWTEGAAILDADCSGSYNDFGLSIGRSGKKMVVMGGIGDRLTEDHTIHSKPIDFDQSYFVTFTRQKSTGEVTLYINGLLHTEADLRDDVILNDSRTIKFGAFNSDEGIPFHGCIGEVIVLDSILSDEKRRRVEKYLSHKWDIPFITVPVNSDKLGLHLDATDKNSLVRDPEERVGEWSAASDINDVVATQTDGVGQPVYIPLSINGMPGLRFNDCFLTMTLNEDAYTPLTIAVVYNPFSSGNIYPGWNYGSGIIDCTGTDGSFGISITKDEEVMMRIGDGTVTAPSSLNTPCLALITLDDADTVRISLNGLLRAENSPGVSPVGGEKEFSIGAIHKLPGQLVSKGAFDGDIGEIILFTRRLDIGERQSLERYLSMKWRIDISGVNSIAKPVLHLDASKVNTVVTDEGDNVSKWLDVNGHTYNAIQEEADHQPLYVTDGYNGLGVVRFDDTKKTALKLPGLIESDFSVFIVYKADALQDTGEYKPVNRDSFRQTAGVNDSLAYDILSDLTTQGFLDNSGTVLEKFRPADTDFTLNLRNNTRVVLKDFVEPAILALLTRYKHNFHAVPRHAFMSIDGINKEHSVEIWTDLQLKQYIDDDGNVLDKFDLNADDYILNLNGINDTVKLEIISVLIRHRYRFEPVTPHAFAGIKTVSDTVSAIIHNDLTTMGHLDANGNVMRKFYPVTQDFTLDIDSDALVETMIINVILAEKWIAGAGLFDGNSPGTKADMSRRDFGLLVKNDNLTVGLGVPGEGDFTVDAASAAGAMHIGIVTRIRDTGAVALYVDDTTVSQSLIGPGVSVKDSRSFTIGAVNTGGNHFKGDIAEIIVLDKVPEKDDIVRIRNYLAMKWGLVFSG